ncbi:hypothetical protein TH53_00115 [Pedobacter lusitanus]|uniref:Uncharacterized protein n=1 Tax=Pedobacter lusitanus TaxID=1503925 RepID=A0A0D0FAZ5_9SPHI|nr:PD40 domain-containing protein [Pedobacter lusitanus]KIO79008.1 hypothetical protein TH53_00115 [Pedobacter lusitanus]
MTIKRLISSPGKIYLLSIAIITVTCSNPEISKMKDGLESFDVSPDGKSLIFTWNIGGKSCLFHSDIDGKNPKLLINSDKHISVYRPRFSPDGRKIVFVGGIPDTFNGAIWIANISGDSLKQITDTSGIKTEAVFSNNGESIYFAQANEYASYSPLANRAAHDFDIYSVALNGGEVSKISDLKAYSLANISDVDSNRLILDMKGTESGVFFYEKGKSVLNKVSFKNDSLSYSKGYSNPILINKDNIICASYYVLVDIDMKIQQEKVILPSDNSSIRVIRYNKGLGRLFIQKGDKLNYIHSMNLDGSDLKNIPIFINSKTTKN